MVRTEDKKYFLYRDGTPYLEKSVEEICESIDVFIFPSVTAILKILDYPFIIQEWLRSIKDCLKRGYNYNDTFPILVRYLAKMQLFSWKNFKYNDSILLNNYFIDVLY
jgi:hypothetical protein